MINRSHCICGKPVGMVGIFHATVMMLDNSFCGDVVEINASNIGFCPLAHLDRCQNLSQCLLLADWHKRIDI